jgi:hypothetical protein
MVTVLEYCPGCANSAGSMETFTLSGVFAESVPVML